MTSQSGHVRAAMAAVPRAAFLPADLRHLAATDGPLPIGHGATNSQPWTVEFMLDLLDVREGAKVLDVGSGSGWSTALLAQLTGPSGSVLGVELVPALVELGRGNLAGFGFGWAGIEPAVPGSLGAPHRAPFDRILVSADAGSIPAALEGQLAVGGRMVLPAGGLMWVVDRSDAGWRREPAPGYRFSFVPLR